MEVIGLARDINNWGVTGLSATATIRQKSCAFSGHRPQKLPWRYDEAATACIALKGILTQQISTLAERGVVHFLTGAAEGTDLYAAEAVLKLRESNPAVKLGCILPCREQAEKWPIESKRRYHAILDQADVIVYVSQSYHKNCMLERNRFMVDFASVLIAAYNGEPRGGTAATLRYARRQGRELYIIDPVTGETSHEAGKVLL